ncbi:hypothetical protein GJV08_05935 [Enterobacteriaceae bacterium RIT692]|nr:hypothetical protein [Enterobacteriaceae bacterium RIT692]
MDIRAVAHACIQWRHLLIWLLSALLLLAALLRLMMTLTAGNAISIELPLSPVTAQNAPRASALNLALFSEKQAWSPFAVGEMAADDARLRDAPRSTLPLKVMGIVHQRSAHQSLAILSDNQLQFTVSSDDALPGYAAKVAHIFPDRVIVQNRGHYESLLMESSSPR